MGGRSGDTREPAVRVAVADRQQHLRLGKPWLERLVRRALSAERVARADICLVLVDDRKIARLHAEWFADPNPTDVITFPFSAPDATVLEGEIVVSAEMAKRRSREFGWQPRQELAYYVVHGLLHLTGHDDTSARASRSMRARERAVMLAMGLPAPPRRAMRRRPA